LGIVEFSERDLGFERVTIVVVAVVVAPKRKEKKTFWCLGLR
jgi:hypothetical protein